MSYGHINFQLTQKDILNFLLKTTWPIKEVNLGRWGGVPKNCNSKTLYFYYFKLVLKA